MTLSACRSCAHILHLAWPGAIPMHRATVPFRTPCHRRHGASDASAVAVRHDYPFRCQELLCTPNSVRTNRKIQQVQAKSGTKYQMTNSAWRLDAARAGPSLTAGQTGHQRRVQGGVPGCVTSVGANMRHAGMHEPSHGTLSGRPPAAQQDLLEEQMLRLVVLLHLRGSRHYSLRLNPKPGDFKPQPAG